MEGDDPVAPADDRELQRAAIATQRGNPGRQGGATEVADLTRHLLAAIQILAHLNLQRGAAEIQGVGQTLFDIHAEPALDPAVEELDGEVVDQQQR